jgi:glycosyltransferase involved in cell wall biosynthesis
MNDAQALHDGMNSVMGDDALRRKLAGRAAEARERFSIERVAGMWEALFMQGIPDAGMRGTPSAYNSTRQTS